MCLFLCRAGPRIQAASNSHLSYELWCTICVYQHLDLHSRKTATLCTCIGASFDRRCFVEGGVGVRAVSAVLSRSTDLNWNLIVEVLSFLVIRIIWDILLNQAHWLVLLAINLAVYFWNISCCGIDLVLNFPLQSSSVCLLSWTIYVSRIIKSWWRMRSSVEQTHLKYRRLLLWSESWWFR